MLLLLLLLFVMMMMMMMMMMTVMFYCILFQLLFQIQHFCKTKSVGGKLRSVILKRIWSHRSTDLERQKLYSMAEFMFYIGWNGFMLRKGGLAPMTDILAALLVYIATLPISVPQIVHGTWKCTNMGHWWNNTERRKTELIWQKTAPMPLCPPQIIHGLNFLLLATFILLVQFLNIFINGTLRNLLRRAEFLFRNFK